MLRTVSKLGDLEGEEKWGEALSRERLGVPPDLTTNSSCYRARQISDRTTQHRENAACSASREKPESHEKRQIAYKGTSVRLPSEFLFATTRRIVFQNTKGNCQPRITYQTMVQERR